VPGDWRLAAAVLAAGRCDVASDPGRPAGRRVPAGPSWWHQV